MFRYDAPDYHPIRILARNEKSLGHWQAVFERRDHFIQKSVDGSI
jgi:hypothetical protein